jgi:MFS transporter, ACS family, tartrate transporter
VSEPAAAVETAAVQRASRRLVPFLFVLYVGAYLDRINVGFAQLQMKSALGFSDSVYGLGAGIFFIGYFIFEVPSNLLLARFGARKWITRIMITWAVLSSATAFVKTPVAFYAIRFLLGAAEAGFFPGMIYYLSQWIPAAQRASVVSRFMTAIAIAGLIGGPVSAGLLSLDGVNGLAGWQWLFLIEGIPSLIMGVMVFLWLPDRPADAKWLTPEQREVLTARIREEAAAIAGARPPSVGQALVNPAVWALALLYFTLLIGLYGLTLWTPQIVKAFSGLSNVKTALLSALPYLAAAVAMVFVGSHSDLRRERARHVAGAALVGSVGMVLSAYASSPIFGIIALCVAMAGVLSALPPFWSMPTALASGTAGAAAIALINSFGNLGGFVSPYVIGSLVQRTHSFKPSLLMVAITLLVGSAIAFSMRRSVPT